MTVANLYLPQQGALSDLASWIAGDLGIAYARLYGNAHVFAPTDTCADYIEAAFAGYVPVNPITWSPPFINGGGKAETDSSALSWTYTAGSGTFAAQGVFLTDAAQSKLLGVYPFLSPVIFQPADPTHSFIAQVTQVSEL